jgi:hypothetical protein
MNAIRVSLLVILLAVVGLLAGGILGRWQDRPRKVALTCECQLVRPLAVEPEFCMVRQCISPADNAVYISTHEITRERCARLVKDGRSEGWDGIVWVGRYVPAWEMEVSY